MAKQQNPFHITLEEKAVTGTPGILDQLDLPPAFITFLQKNQRKIWTVTGVAAVIVTLVALCGSYRDYTLNKAALAYDKAVLLEDSQQKAAALQKVTEDYASTPSATWSRIALAHLDQEAGNIKGAVEKLTSLNSTLGEDDVLRPLLLVNLGGLYEQDKQFGQAEKMYLQLKKVKGFEAMALSSLGRVYEALASTDKAVTMYQQYMGLTGKGSGTVLGQEFPARDVVQSSLNRLMQ